MRRDASLNLGPRLLRIDRVYVSQEQLFLVCLSDGYSCLFEAYEYFEAQVRCLEELAKVPWKTSNKNNGPLIFALCILQCVA
jgi:hypothetical protein